jgi:hypothetical protein
LQNRQGPVAADGDHIRRQASDRGCFLPYPVHLGTRPLDFDPNIAAVVPAQLAQRVEERRNARLTLRISLPIASWQHADAPHFIGLLRARRERPCGGGAE